MMENMATQFFDYEPPTSHLLEEVMVGLSKHQKAISPKFLYDKKGSEIFERICHVPEYYPTRAEKEILETYAHEMSDLIGSEALVIEPGSGSGEKVRYILRELEAPLGYVPIEISKEILLRMTEELFHEFPGLKVLPVCADFTEELDLPLSVEAQRGKKVIFFPGSTIGNLNPDEAIGFLKQTGRMLSSGGGYLIGVDIKKDPDVLERAYDDVQGVTAAFNMNLLKRMNREIGASFDLRNFRHEAIYNEDKGRIEMHLRSLVPQMVRVNQAIFQFREGETIHTESSYKYSVGEFSELCAKAGLVLRKYWQDSQGLFCMYYFEKE